MGQILLPEKIGALSQSGGVLTLGPSIINIGGQQYRPGTLSLTLPTLTANQLYMIYAVLVGGVVTLVQDTAVNSAGPTGQTLWRLVGAYYANGLLAFGSFVNIYGSPESGSVIQGPVPITGNGGTNPTKGSPITEDNGVFSRLGQMMSYNYTYVAPASSVNGSGAYILGIPANLVIDITKHTNGVSLSTMETVGSFKWGNNAFAYTGSVCLADATHFQLSPWTTGSASNLNFTGTAGAGAGLPMNASQVYGGLSVIVPILGWSSTQLFDL